jgi:RimJ/RimL family protein N-acetyltransferase
VADHLLLRPLVDADFDAARAVADDWFGHPVGLTMHRLFFEQLGAGGVHAALANDPGRMVGVLLGLRSENDPDLAYVHFHMVDPDMRGQGVGRALYEEFCRSMHERGCGRVRALAAPGNAVSRRFHEALGFVGTFHEAYVGPGQDRFVFERALPL